jgi:hypothetical protein
VPPLVAFVISFLTSMGGMSGAFLLLPFQMSFLGYTTPSVSATNHLFNVVAIPGGVYRYWKEGRMVWPLTWAVLAGILPGVLVGAYVRVAWMPDPARFKPFAAAVLFYIGARMVWDLGRKRAHTSRAPRAPLSTVTVTHSNWRRLAYSFGGEEYAVAVPGIVAVSLAVGVVGGIYGIGGGAIIAPLLITFFKLPVHTIAGTALMGTFVASAAAVVFYQVLALLYPDLAVAPDWMLGVFFGVGGAAGIYLGARCQKLVPAAAIKWMLAAVTLLAALRYVFSSLV